MRQQGWMQVDNGAPVLTEAQARALNLPLDYARKSVVEVDTLHCKHCGRVVIKNPDRIRPRAHCMKCNWFMCDDCAAAASQPDYQHETFLGKAEKVRSALSNIKCI